MTTLSLAITLALLLPIAAYVAVKVVVVNRRRAAWRLERPAWWDQALPRVLVEQSVTVAGQRPPAEVVEVRDPRVIGPNRRTR